MQYTECVGIIGWWVGLFLVMWAAIYAYGRGAAAQTLGQIAGRLGGGIVLLIGLLLFFMGFVQEMIACDCAHAWWHVVGSLSATALIAGPIMLVAPRLQRG